MLYTVAIAGILGALFNRIRGGWLVESSNDAVHAVAFGLGVGVVTGNGWVGLAALAGMWLGMSWGWGRYIGALGAWEKNDLDEVPFIDFLILPLRPRPMLVKENKVTYEYRKGWLRAWGFAGLTLRGGLIGLCLLPAVFLWEYLGGAIAPWWMAGSLLMGVCYAIALPLRDDAGEGWEVSEVLYGAVLWPCAVLAFMG